MGAARSCPPPPPEAETTPSKPRRPGLAKAVLKRRLTVRDVLREWKARHGISERKLADEIGVSKKRADNYLDGDAPFPAECILAVAENDNEAALDLIDALRSLVLARRTPRRA